MCDDNIKIYIKVTGYKGGDCIQLALCRFEWQPLLPGNDYCGSIRVVKWLVLPSVKAVLQPVGCCSLGS